MVRLYPTVKRTFQAIQGVLRARLCKVPRHLSAGTNATAMWPDSRSVSSTTTKIIASGYKPSHE
jgi:hypothetical protein